MEIGGRTVIVTGAGGDGSGRAIAQRFARDGAAVVANDIVAHGARETVASIERDGGRAVASSYDICSEERVRELFGFAEKTFGSLAVVVNNASAEYHPGEPLDYWRETIETDLLSVVFTTRLAIDAMRRSGRGGAIVNMSSISALPFGGDNAADVPAYDAAKAGVMRLTSGLAELAQSDNIRVNCIAPGWIASVGPRTYWESLTPEERKARGVPSRMLSLDEVADAIVRLATDESLFGRVLVWHSEDVPRLIRFADRGYESLDDTPFV
jgi:NAD(P)-dependent dehydrogenase (short-subunit alcohol dehydrogenase family)